MAYKLAPDEGLRDGLQRGAREQLDLAVDELSTGVSEDPVEAVHDARKALKKTRALLRLGRAAIDPDVRRRENAALRDTGRSLSCARDAEVMVEAVEELSERFAGRVPQATFDAVRGHLEAERDQARQRLLESGLADQAAEELKAARRRLAGARLRQGGWKALEPGLVRSYRRGAAALAVAREKPTVENLHEWRKRTKDLWYHLRLLKPLSPGIVGGQAEEAHRISELLGDDHDLAVLRESLRSGAYDLPIDLDAVIELIDHRRSQLQSEALRAGRRVYAERPKAFRRRLRRYWRTWRRAPRSAAIA